MACLFSQSTAFFYFTESSRWVYLVLFLILSFCAFFWPCTAQTIGTGIPTPRPSSSSSSFSWASGSTLTSASTPSEVLPSHVPTTVIVPAAVAVPTTVVVTESPVLPFVVPTTTETLTFNPRTDPTSDHYSSRRRDFPDATDLAPLVLLGAFLFGSAFPLPVLLFGANTIVYPVGSAAALASAASWLTLDMFPTPEQLKTEDPDDPDDPEPTESEPSDPETTSEVSSTTASSTSMSTGPIQTITVTETLSPSSVIAEISGADYVTYDDIYAYSPIGEVTTYDYGGMQTSPGASASAPTTQNPTTVKNPTTTSAAPSPSGSLSCNQERDLSGPSGDSLADGLRAYNTLDTSANEPLEFYQNALNAIISACIEQQNFFGGTYQQGSEQYEVFNSEYPDNQDPLTIPEPTAVPEPTTSDSRSASLSSSTYGPKTGLLTAAPSLRKKLKAAEGSLGGISQTPRPM
ncbi:hypothetical protein AJ80_03087 [Polytolypa hystricis UAMH7299]|uniref:Uncharacterized protein n=1 Tax=Polytolypa hystricis (strain UAMH7299) TaxID=1447883 RepID=A0A2B7YC49_POLH7|nr:hypothetical protein AJ80_03087 [Polytolypa hystricis UAMH7299]